MPRPCPKSHDFAPASPRIHDAYVLHHGDAVHVVGGDGGGRNGQGDGGGGGDGGITPRTSKNCRRTSDRVLHEFGGHVDTAQAVCGQHRAYKVENRCLTISSFVEQSSAVSCSVANIEANSSIGTR